MRLTKDELKTQYFPLWNDSRHDIVAVNYGDEPLIQWDVKLYEEFSKLSGSLANLMCANAYVFSQNGDYNIYRTLIGDTYIKPDGTVLSGNINVKFRGKTYNVILNRMYGWNALTILRLGEKVVGFCNKDGQGSPSSKVRTEEMNQDVVERIINDALEDYGFGIQKFMDAVREVYNMDNTNCIMDKCFNM